MVTSIQIGVKLLIVHEGICHVLNYILHSGTSQPGCGIDLTGNCGHSLVSNFYAASINPNNHFGATRFV